MKRSIYNGCMKDGKMDTKKLWIEIKKKIRELINNDERFETWIVPNRLVSIGEGKVVIKAPDYFYVDWLNTYYKKFFEEAIFDLTGENFVIEFVADIKRRKLREGEPKRLPFMNSTRSKATGLRSIYSFDNFVVGENTKFVYTVCKTVSEKPGSTYNPLYIYGGTGLGKTHLLHAIGNHAMEKNSGIKVRYIEAEKLFLEFIESISKHKQLEFKNKYRTTHILLVDDIQFLSGKDVLQEEFFHTLNSLCENGKQVVVTSDRSPNEIKGLKKRLKSRFYKGLVVEIPEPDLETRIAILIRKAEEQNFELPPDIAYYMASRIKSNIGKLEGALIKLIALSSITGREIDEDLASEVIKDMVEHKENISNEDIINLVAMEFNCKPGDIKSRDRTKNIVRARQSLIYILREKLGLSYNEIGKIIKRDHSTIISAYKKIKKIYKNNLEIKLKIDRISRSIDGE